MNGAWMIAGAVSVALLVGCSGELETVDGRPTKDEVVEKIVGGRAEAGFPAVGALLTPQGNVCTATVIAPRWIVSAAHCFEDGDFGYTLNLGQDMQRPVRRVPLTAIWRHPAWNQRSLTNDIALGQLGADPGVQPMALAPTVARGEVLTFVGFGLTDGRGWELGEKRSVDMALQRVDATTFRYSVPGKNTCGGDSGGPALRTVGGVHQVAGVTSYGDAGCAEYGVDTRVDAYLGWIRDVIGDLPADPPADNGVPAPPVAEDPCGGLDYLGECSGSVARWCADGAVKERDCGAQGCGYIDDSLGYYCGGAAQPAPAPAPAPADPCRGLDYLGRCSGAVAEWCDGGQLQASDCGQQGLGCGYVDDQVGFYCRR